MIRSVILLLIAQVAALSLWFSSSAVIPALAAETGLSLSVLGRLSTATQFGFVTGALFFAVSGLADRLDPRRVFVVCAGFAALANGVLLMVSADGAAALLSRFCVGVALAGVYPVGLKIAVGWSLTRRGLLSSLLVGALTLGTASSHVAALIGATDWRSALLGTSFAAGGAGFLVLFSGLGPHHQRAARFNPAALGDAWRNRGVRNAYLGYFGHMWELYAFWAWIGVVMTVAATEAGVTTPETFGSQVAVIAVGLGGLACLPSGWLADRYGKDRVARVWLMLSAASASAAALTYTAPLWVFTLVVIIWGISIIPDSPQFSALVADAAPPDRVGSLLTLQTAFGFALSAVTVQGAPVLAAEIGWDGVMAVLALGPLAGVWAMWGYGKRPDG